MLTFVNLYGSKPHEIMKRTIEHIGGAMLMALVCMLMACNGQQNKQTQAEEVGTLTAYYATEDFTTEEGPEYQKGQLICDTNDPMNRVVDYDDTHYKYEGDDTGAEYSWLLPKAKVEKKTYTMNQLSVEAVGQKAIFVSEDGGVARIFWSTINGHQYFNWNGEELDWKATEAHSECYVLSIEYYAYWDEEKHLFEDPLLEKQGNIDLYRKNPYDGDEAVPSNCRYREGPIGIIEEKWLNKEDWGYDKTGYSQDGKLLVDQCADEGIPAYISIAYIADLDALYVDGKLYFRQ